MADRYAVVRGETTALVRETGARARVVLGTTALLWAIEIVDRIVFWGGLDRFGIHPRTLWGLAEIGFAPFLHAGFGHLAANTLPLIVLGFLASGRKVLDFWVVGAASAIAAGLGAWLLGGAGTVHLGASGVVFGYLGFLMGRGLFERRAGAIALSAVVTFLFGGMLIGLLPLFTGISWQAHLFGWLGGLATARLLGREIRKRQKER